MGVRLVQNRGGCVHGASWDRNGGGCAWAEA